MSYHRNIWKPSRFCWSADCTEALYAFVEQSELLSYLSQYPQQAQLHKLPGPQPNENVGAALWVCDLYTCIGPMIRKAMCLL